MTAHKPHIQVLNQQAELFELMASVEFISIPFVIAQIAKECEETAEADFLLNAKRIQHAIKCLWAALKKSIDLTSLMLNTLLFDLKGYDCEFAFVPPPSLQGHHLSEALKAIHNNPETLSKYDYIGFKREELETILGFSLLTTEQQAKKAELDKLITEQHSQTLQEGNNAGKSKRDETADQIIVCLSAELAKIAPQKYLWGGKINQSALSKKCATQEMSYLFKHPKGEETYRERLKSLSFIKN